MGWMDFHEYLLVADAVRDRLDDLSRATDSEAAPPGRRWRRWLHGPVGDFEAGPVESAPEYSQPYSRRVRRGITTHVSIATGIAVETAGPNGNGKCKGWSKKCNAMT
jgi:hypothetical protein